MTTIETRTPWAEIADQLTISRYEDQRKQEALERARKVLRLCADAADAAELIEALVDDLVSQIAKAEEERDWKKENREKDAQEAALGAEALRKAQLWRDLSYVDDAYWLLLGERPPVPFAELTEGAK